MMASLSIGSSLRSWKPGLIGQEAVKQRAALLSLIPARNSIQERCVCAF